MWILDVVFSESHVLAVVLPGRGLCFLEKECPFFKSCASSGFAWQGPLFFGKRGSLFLSHVLAVVLPGRGLCFLEKEGPADGLGPPFWAGPLGPRSKIHKTHLGHIILI